MSAMKISDIEQLTRHTNRNQNSHLDISRALIASANRVFYK